MVPYKKGPALSTITDNDTEDTAGARMHLVGVKMTCKFEYILYYQFHFELFLSVNCV